MADIDVKNRSSKQGSGEGSQGRSTALEHRGSGADVSHHGTWNPYELNPIEFFNNPFTAMRRLSDEMDRSFGRMFSQPSTGGGTRAGGWHPAMEIVERNGELHVSAELPGLNPEDVKVEVTNDSLIVHGERKYEHEGKEGNAYHSERRYGQFYREIALPEGVNAEQAKAQFRNGVLEVTLPMPQQANKRREIPIQSGSSTSSTVSAGGSTSSRTGGSTQSGGQATGQQTTGQTTGTASGSSSKAGGGTQQKNS